MYRNALITGASSGIGRAIAIELAKKKIEVVLCARRAVELERLRDDIVTAGGHAHICVMDVQKTDETVAQIQQFDDRLSGLDLVIANAGAGTLGSMKRMKWEDIRDVAQINFTGAIATLTAVLARMVTRKGGHLVGVSSLIAKAPLLPGSLIYQTTKVGLSHFLSGLQFELEGSGVCVTAIHPGFVHTKMTAGNKNPMPFVMEVEEAAALIVRKLERRPAQIDFPLPMVAGTMLGGVIPQRLAKVVTSRLRIG